MRSLSIYENLYGTKEEILEEFDIFIDCPPRSAETFGHWYKKEDFDPELRAGEHPALISKFDRDFMRNVDFNQGISFSSDLWPIPWQIRFPSRYLLNHIPAWPQKKPKKGRPLDWALDLLVSELSQANMKNKEIATLLRASASKLLFGEVRAYKGTSDKDPFLVRINDIKKRVKKILSKVYPLRQFT